MIILGVKKVYIIKARGRCLITDNINMNLNEKFEKLNAFVVSLKMNEEEIEKWFQSRRNSSSGDSKSTSRSEGIKSIFPIVYKKGNDFEILPELDLARKDEVWGYEIMPGIVLARKCGCDNNVESTTWYEVKSFAESCRLNGKQGKLLSTEVLLFKQIWSRELRENIQKMDAFLCKNGIDAENDCVGIFWCSDVYDRNTASTFSLDTGDAHLCSKTHTRSYDRVVVAF